MRDTEREAEAEGEAGSMQGARNGARSRVSRIRPWAEGGAKLRSHQGCPNFYFSFFHLFCQYCPLCAEHRCWGVPWGTFKSLFVFVNKDFIYVFMSRGRSRLHAGSPMRDSIPRLQGHAEGKHSTAEPPRCPSSHYLNWSVFTKLSSSSESSKKSFTTQILRPSLPCY